MGKLNKPKNTNPEVKQTPVRKRLTPYEKERLEITEIITELSKDITTLYKNVENLMVYATVIANVNAAIAQILIKKKIFTENNLKKQYDAVLKEMAQKEKEIREKFEALDNEEKYKNINLTDINLDGMKVS